MSKIFAGWGDKLNWWAYKPLVEIRLIYLPKIGGDQSKQEIYRERNSSTVVFSCLANLARLSAGTKNPMSMCSHVILIVSLNLK